MSEKKSSAVTVGIVGIVLVVTISLATLQYNKLPFIRSGATFTAFFVDAGGLVPGDPVHVAGVRSGEVDQVSLDGPKVLVKFTLDESIVLGQKTSAAIKTNTVLGRKSLDVVPTGQGALRTSDTIPLDRTTSPYSLNEAQMKPTLDRLNSVLGLLQRNKQNLTEALEGIGPYASALGEQVGNGPWFNAYVVNATSTELRPLVDALVWPEHLPQDLIDIFTHPRTPSIQPTEEDPPR